MNALNLSKELRRSLVIVLFGALTVSVPVSASVSKAHYGTLPDGQSVSEFTLTNANGLIAKVITYGGIMTELHVPDRNGTLADVLVGFGSLDDFINEESPYFGALIGRYGNRIGGGVFTLDGEEFELALNDEENHLHGGEVGFDKVLWDAEVVSGKTAVRLHRISPDGEEGYPGNLDVTVIYELTDANELIISYEATTDKPTIVNLTNHNYYNLRGQGRGSIVGHELTINADFFTPVDEGLIPTGEMLMVEGTPMDFRQARPIGGRIDADFEQLKFGLGYDHNWVLNRTDPSGMNFAARLYDPDSGREMRIYTTEPGIQFYSGNFLDGTLTGKDGAVYHFRYGLCLETQHFPDSPNKGHFPSTRLNPGETYRTVTKHKFSVQ